MDCDEAKAIATLDMTRKGVKNCRNLKCCLIEEAGMWNLVYVCNVQQNVSGNFRVYLIDNDTGQIRVSVP